MAGSAEAQYFGRNKVEYVDFDFKVLRTQHFDVYHYAREEPAARIAARLAERWYSRFSGFLKHEFNERQPLVLYGSQPEFAQTNVVSGLLSDTVGGVTESAKRRIAMPFAPTLAETNRVLGHEIAHAFQFDIARRQRFSPNQPLWFIEGMAEYLARGAADVESGLWLRDAVLSERLPARERDASRKLSPYQYGHAFWSYLAGRFGDDVVPKALRPPKSGKLENRMRHATGLELETLFADWRAAVHSTIRPPSEAVRSDVTTRFLDSTAAGKVQLGPALSPDGRHAVFFSERDRFALDLFLADVSTGQVIRKLATTTANARFDSLQPLRSAGAWSSAGDSFTFAAVRRGHAALILLDMRQGARADDREIDFPQLGQILTVTWSPDGRSLAFSALADGFTNLYTYDLAQKTLRQLTDDAFADLHPAWSPDGQKIAFTTDRYSTDLGSLSFGRTELALVDVVTGEVSAIPSRIDAAGAINPQWSVDGSSIYFIADRDNISNVFRLSLNEGSLHRISEVPTGVSGLTPTSPALSLARQMDALAFTVYRGGRHQLAVLTGPAALAGAPVTDTRLADVAAPEGTLEQLLRDHKTGLPDQTSIQTRDYRPRLALEGIGQPYLSSGGGAFGTFFRAGGSMLFGDMLGERRLGTAVQFANRMRDMAFETRFLNREHRWNWGAIAELEPALRRYRFAQTIDHQGAQALMKQVDYMQRMQMRVAGLVAYPLSRSLRVEFTGGVRHERYYRDLRSRISLLDSGRIIEEARVESSGGSPTTVGEISTALVGDTAVFGPTGPLLGTRYRLEVAPAAGGLTYTSVVADYRRYLMPVKPYTVAMRLLHSGRFGRDGDDQRLLPNFLGSRYYVRGHGWDARNCRPDPESGCGAELFGNRLLVANLEIRVPVWGMLSRQLDYGPLPVDAFVFADGGMVWSQRRTTISSIGAGVRMNAGGLPFEVSAVRALDGPTPGWSGDFGFRVGF